MTDWWRITSAKICQCQKIFKVFGLIDHSSLFKTIKKKRKASVPAIELTPPEANIPALV
ncbi:hypothetical protein ACET1H_05345 [Escherichia coli]|uniref:hypothetical protein n=1 Tax=Escherichia coli TaxID=562 RepID=UPI0035A71B7E